MKVGDKEVSEITITGIDNVLIASITDQDIITQDGYKVNLNYSTSCHQD